MNKKPNALLKKDNNQSLQTKKSITNQNINDAQNRLKGICKSLLIHSKDYRPVKTVNAIKNYIKSSQDIGRLLYFQISNQVFALDTNERGIFSTNIDKLIDYSMDEKNNVDAECRTMIIKIYDHFQLALCQMERMNSILANGIEETKENLEVETKRMEKEYVAILGIFAAIVLAFVGGMTFSTSVLQNISQVSIYRIVLVALIIGLVFINIIFGLFYYIDRLVRTKSESRIKPLFITNGIILILIISTLASWFLGTVEHRNKAIYAIDNQSVADTAIELQTDK